MICGGNPHLLNSVFGRLRTETKAGNCKGSSFVTEVAYKATMGNYARRGINPAGQASNLIEVELDAHV